jgi:putative intracellular protease/amidase
MTRVLIVLSGATTWNLKDGEKHPTGFWVEEFAVPDRIFRDAGFDITIATPGGVTPTGDELSLAPAMNNNDEAKVAELRAYLNASQDVLAAAVPLADIDSAEFDVILVPGGHAPMEDLATNTDIARIYSETLDNPTKVVAALCHGVASFSSAKRDGKWLFEGRRITGFLDEEENQAGFGSRAPWLLESRMREFGADFVAGPAWGSHVVVEGNLVTGQNPASAEEAANAVISLLASRV